MYSINIAVLVGICPLWFKNTVLTEYIEEPLDLVTSKKLTPTADRHFCDFALAV